MFQDFLREKKYLLNVSPRTLEWYEQALGWLTVAKPKDKDLKNLVIKMREKGLKARSDQLISDSHQLLHALDSRC